MRLHFLIRYKFVQDFQVQTRTDSDCDVKLCCVSVCVCLMLASDRSRAIPLRETGPVNTDSQRSVNCALPLATLKPALSAGQLPGYIQTVRQSDSQQRGSRAPQLSVCRKQIKLALKHVW